MNGVIEILLWTLGLSLLLAVIYRVLTNPEEMKRLKENAKGIQAKIKKAQKSGNTDEVSALTSETLKASNQQFMKNMKPMLASTVMFFVFMWLVGEQYRSVTVDLPFTFVSLTRSLPFVKMTAHYGFLMWYVAITLPATMFFRKMLGVE